MEPEADELNQADQLTPKVDYTKLPNYHLIRHFEEPLTDEQFLEIIVERLNNMEDVTYKTIKEELLPKHRKPLFKDYLRFRLIETVLLHEEFE